MPPGAAPGAPTSTPPVAAGGPVSIDQLLPVLQSLISAVQGLITALQGQMQAGQPPAGAPAGGGGPDGAQAGADTVGGGAPPAGMGGCSCGGGAAAPAAGGGDTGGAAGAPAPEVAAPAPSPPAPAPDPAGPLGPLPAKDERDEGKIRDFIKKAAAAYGANPDVLQEIARRESSFHFDSVNNWDSNAKKGTPSKGMFQFIEPTFNSYGKSAHDAKPELWKDLGGMDWMDWRQQALATAWAITNGHGSAWATFKAAGG